MIKGGEKIEISFASILRLFVVVLVLILIFLIRDILVILFIAFLISSGLLPVINYLNKKIPRIFSVALVYITLILLLAVFIFVIQNSLSIDFSQFYNQVKDGKFNTSILGFHIDAEKISSQFASSLDRTEIGGIVSGARKFISGLTGIIIVFVLSFYMLLEKNGVKDAMRGFLPEHTYRQFLHLIVRIEEKLGGWLRGQMILMMVVGVLTYILLKALGMPYAGILAVISGLTEIIPGVGPVFAGFIGVVVAAVVFPDIPARWLLVAGGYFLIQQFENHVLVPQVMKKAVGLSPIVILVSLLVGARLFGIVGAFIAVPAAAAISVVIKEWETSLKKAGRGVVWK